MDTTPIPLDEVLIDVPTGELIGEKMDEKAPPGVDPKLWKIWCDEDALKQDQFLYQLKRGMKGQNVGLDNGLSQINRYIYGTHKARYYLIGAESSAGKCLGKGTKVVMFDGTLKEVELLKPGDKLMGVDSTPRTIQSTCTGKEQMYWIRQKQGQDYRVNESHILSVFHKPISKYSSSVKADQQHIKKSLRKRNYRLEGTYPSTLINKPLTELLKLNKTKLKEYQGWKTSANFGNNEVTLDPYFLGLWLGDGTSSGTGITNIEPEIASYLVEYATKNDLKLKAKGNGSSAITTDITALVQLERIDPITNVVVEVYDSAVKAKQYGRREYISHATCSGKIVGGFKWNWKVLHNNFLLQLHKYALINNKHVPQDYINSTVETRAALIAGLIDTDGYYDRDKGTVEITQKRECLANQIVFIVRSLGFYASINSKIATMRRKDGTIYKCKVFRVLFQHSTLFPCIVERKKCITPTLSCVHKTGITIEKDIVDDYYGFTIDGDRLFLLEDFTVTHNTSVGDFMFVINAWLSAKKQGRKIKIFYCSFEIGKIEKLYRWCSYFIFIKYGIRLPSDYMQGRIVGKLVQDNHMNLILEAYSMVTEMLKDVVIIQDTIHPTKIFEGIIDDHYSLHGTVHRAEISDADKKKGKKGYVKGYTENDPQMVTILVIDHLALTGTEMHLETKGIMDKMSKYAIVLRNLFNCTIVFYQQFSTDMMSAYRGLAGKKTEATIAPQRLDFGDSKATYRDADVVFGLIKPQNDVSTFMGYDLNKVDGLGDCFLANYLMKNRYGPAMKTIPLFMDGSTGFIYDLPLTPTNPIAMQPWYDKAKEISQLCLEYCPQSL